MTSCFCDINNNPDNRRTRRHELSHFAALEELERNLKTLAVDLGCECPSSCYQAKMDVLTSSADVFLAQYNLNISYRDCMDNGGGDMNSKWCGTYIGSQAQLIIQSEKLVKAGQKVSLECKK